MGVEVQDSINQNSKDFFMVTTCQFSSIQIYHICTRYIH